MTNTPKSLLFDIIQNGERIKSFLIGTPTFEEFAQDVKTRYAVERCIEIIGEASQKLRKQFSLRLTLSDRAYNFRGSLVHQYDIIKGETIYNFATKDIPLLVEEAKKALQKLEESYMQVQPSLYLMLQKKHIMTSFSVGRRPFHVIR